MYTEIDLKLNIGDLNLNVNQAIPFVLIVNELVTNAYKYAFTGRDKEEIRLSLEQKNQQISLKIIDDGVGLPEDFNLDNP